MADRVTFWTRVTIGGVEYPPDDAPRGPCPGTNRLITPARDFGVCPVCGRYWPHFVGDDSGSVRLFAVPIHDNDMERAVLLFFESLFRLHDRALLRAAIANSDAPQICDAYEPADRPGYDACARCGWSSRIHDGPTTIAQLLDGASPAERALVKGAFLEAAREHAPEWAPLLEADEDG